MSVHVWHAITISTNLLLETFCFDSITKHCFSTIKKRLQPNSTYSRTRSSCDLEAWRTFIQYKGTTVAWRSLSIFICKVIAFRSAINCAWPNLSGLWSPSVAPYQAGKGTWTNDPRSSKQLLKAELYALGWCVILIQQLAIVTNDHSQGRCCQQIPDWMVYRYLIIPRPSTLSFDAWRFFFLGALSCCNFLFIWIDNKNN
jgi:hypothetical protein